MSSQGISHLSLRACFVILVCFLACNGANAQELLVTCDRSTIQTYTGEEKEPVLRFFDNARQASDEFMRMLAEGRYDEIRKRNRFLSIYLQNRSDERMVQTDLSEFLQQFGQLGHYEYRNQSLGYLLSGPIELKGTVSTWYEVSAGDSPDGHYFLSVGTTNSQVGELPWVTTITSRPWAKSGPAPWQYFGGTGRQTKGCSTMEKRLRVNNG